MNITGLGSASWYTGAGSTSARSAGTTTREGAGDSASFSTAALTALARQEGGPPPITDAMAAEFGARLQEEDPELFAAIDSDADGTLTAAEMEEGREQVHAAMESKGQGMMGAPPPPPGDGGSDAASDDERVQELLQALAEQGWSDVEVNQLSDVLSRLMAGQTA